MKVEIMLDLETTGVTPGCGILSIGALTMDFKQRFYMKVRPDSNRRQFLTLEPATMAWWDKQSEEARKEAFDEKAPNIEETLLSFHDWLNSLQSDRILCWGNGADFDVPILRKAYAMSRLEIPVLHARCFRTLRELYPEVPAPEFIGVKHNALADARNQAEHLLAIRKERKE